MTTSTDEHVDDVAIADTAADSLTDPVADDTEPASAEETGRTSRRLPSGTERRRANALIRMPHPTGRIRRAVVAGMLVLILGLAAAVGILGFGELNDRAVGSARTDAVAVAAASLPKLLSYDAASLDGIPAVVDEVTTGRFHDDFRTTFEQLIGPNAREQQASSTATVVSSAAIESKADEVTVLLLLDQRTTSTKLVGERLDTVQAVVTMEHVDGRWLISGLDQV